MGDFFFSVSWYFLLFLLWQFIFWLFQSVFLANSSCFSNSWFITGDNKRYLCLGKLLNIIKASLLTPCQHPWAQHQAVLGIPDTHFHWNIDGSVLPNLTFPWVHATKDLIFLFIALVDLGKTGLFLSSALCNATWLLSSSTFISFDMISRLFSLLHIWCVCSQLRSFSHECLVGLYFSFPRDCPNELSYLKSLVIQRWDVSWEEKDLLWPM